MQYRVRANMEILKYIGSKTKFETIIERISKEWNDLVEINVKSDWKPQNKQQFNQQEKKKKRIFRKKL